MLCAHKQLYILGKDEDHGMECYFEASSLSFPIASIRFLSFPTSIISYPLSEKTLKRHHFGLSP